MDMCGTTELRRRNGKFTSDPLAKIGCLPITKSEEPIDEIRNSDSRFRIARWSWPLLSCMLPETIPWMSVGVFSGRIIVLGCYEILARLCGAYSYGAPLGLDVSCQFSSNWSKYK